MCSLRKIPSRLRGTNFCTSSARFTLSFVRQPNGPECAQIVRNAPKHQFRVQWVGSGAFVAKNSDATSWHELLHLFGPFCIKFRKATKQSGMHPNSTNDEDTTSTSTPAAPSLASPDAPPPQAPPSGPITRARARELNFVMLLKNEGPEE